MSPKLQGKMQKDIQQREPDFWNGTFRPQDEQAPCEEVQYLGQGVGCFAFGTHLPTIFPLPPSNEMSVTPISLRPLQVHATPVPFPWPCLVSLQQ